MLTRPIVAAVSLVVLATATASAQTQTPPPAPPASKPIAISGYGGVNAREFTNRNTDIHPLAGVTGGLDFRLSRFFAFSTEVSVARTRQRQFYFQSPGRRYTNFLDLLGGIRVSFPGPVRPFVELFAGYSAVEFTFSGAYSGQSLSLPRAGSGRLLRPGLGVDVPLGRRVSARLQYSLPLVAHHSEESETYHSTPQAALSMVYVIRPR